jgi:pimeloyl-ACP methyl ester carboxylesterase
MKKTCLFITVLCIATASVAQKLFDEEEVFYHNKDIRLSGIVLKPAASAKTTATGVILIHGSGNSDRSNLWAYSFAEDLASKGFTVLLPDKRGCGKSGGNWKAAAMSDLAMDAVAAIDFLLDHKKYGIRKAGFMGLSQGGMIVPMAAHYSDKASFIIDISGSALTMEQTIIHEIINTCKKSGFTVGDVAQVLALHASMKKYMFGGNFDSYEKQRNEMSKGALSNFAKGFPAGKDAWIWQWGKKNLMYAPEIHWAKVTKPALIIYGENDESDNTPVFQSTYLLEKIFQHNNNAKYTIKIFPETGHALYMKDRATIRTDVFEQISSWIVSQTNNKIVP